MITFDPRDDFDPDDGPMGPSVRTGPTVATAPRRGLSVAGPWVAEAIRRGLDIAIALGALVLLAPLLLGVAWAIRRDSEGPVIFRQERIGRGRRPFVLLKFRTMVPSADPALHRAYVETLIQGAPADAIAATGPMHGPPAAQQALYKLTVDPRITRIGRRLRDWSIDELPQLVNVLRGDMALVGPRPVIPYEAELYPDAYLARFRVKPGLTGLWQVSGRNRCTYKEMVDLDVAYVNRRSLWLDLRILARTIPVVLGREGVA